MQPSVRRRVEHRDALVDVVRGVGATDEPEKIAEFVIERVATWVPAPCWALVSAEPGGQLSILVERGLGGDFCDAVHAVTAWVVEHGEEFMTANLCRDPRVPDQPAATVVAFPLRSRGRQVGALVGLDGSPSMREPRLAPVVVRALRLLLEPAAAALENAVRLQRAEALSITDDLTQLSNSRHLNQVLRHETKRAARTARPLSLLFVDLDGFKSVNDRYGHLFGSRALVEAAAVIRGSARETDVVARFGGDEFALVLPDTGEVGALAVAQRVRERLASHQFLADHGLAVRLTASVGIATLPDVAFSPEELVQAADAAMYQVKDRGKNGIQTAVRSAR